MLILDGAAFLLILLFKRETFAPQILHYKAKQFRKRTGNENFKTAAEASHGSVGAVLTKCFTRPFLLCTEPIIMAFTFYLAVVYIILFTFLDGYVFGADLGKLEAAGVANFSGRYPYIFAETYSINEGLSNVCFVALLVGTILSAGLVPVVYHATVRQLQRDGDDGSGKAIFRESRLYFAMIGAPALPIGLFWMGWTDNVSVVNAFLSRTFQIQLF